MVTDPAWFYSSVAQSAAAIVGLIAAIFGTRLIDHVRNVSDVRSGVVAHIDEVRRLFDNRVLGMTRYGPYLREEIADAETAEARGEKERTPKRGMSWDSIEPREGPYRPELLANNLRALRDYLRLWEKVHPAYTRLRGTISVDGLRNYIVRLRSLSDEIGPPDASVPGSMLRADAGRLEQVLLEVEAFQSLAFPRIFIVFVVLLAWITWIGLIVPLRSLSIQPDQSSILRGFSVGMLLIVVYFAFEVVRLWLLSRVSWGRV